MVSFGRIEFSIGVGVAGLLLLATYLWLDSTSTSGAKVGHEYSNLLSELQKQQHHLLSEMKKQHDEVLKAMNSQHDDQTRLLIHQQSVALNQSEGAVVPPVFMTNQHSVQEQIHKLASEQIEWLQKLQAAVTQLREVNGTAEHEAMSTALVQHFEVLYQMHSMLEPIVNQSIVINKDKPIKPPPQREIYISIIMVLRNDDYGGNMGGRLSNWLELFSYEANAVGLSQDVEVIFVEWNPVPNKPLVDLMKTVLPADKKFPIRIITVPNEVHKTITNPNGIEVYEYMAKNVGIRRAKGKFILCTNPDSLFNPEIVGFLAKRKLSEKAFYTMFRTFDSWGLPSGSTQQKLDALISKTRHDHGHGGDALGEELCKNGFIEENKFPQRSWPVDDAPGDFYMISREGAFSFRGFSQRNQNFNLDSYILCMSLSHGFAQLVPKAPCLLAHQAHNRPPSYGYVTPGWNANSFCGNLLNTKKTPYPPEDNGGENWGWADTTFPQVTL